MMHLKVMKPTEILIDQPVLFGITLRDFKRCEGVNSLVHCFRRDFQFCDSGGSAAMVSLRIYAPL